MLEIKLRLKNTVKSALLNILWASKLATMLSKLKARYIIKG